MFWLRLFVGSSYYKIALTLANVVIQTLYNYIPFLCLTLFSSSFKLLIRNWKTVPTFLLWSVDVEKNSSIYWAFAITHILAWSVICGGCVLYDLPELLGLSQVYNDINNCLPPLAYKSTELKRLISRVRHPSFLALSVILWVTNLMRYILHITGQ